MDTEGIRLGVVRDTMHNNPLLRKAPIGQAKMNTRSADEVYGIKSLKNDGGTAAALQSSSPTADQTSLEVEAAKRRNHLLSRPEVGRAKAPISGSNILDVVHGRKGVKDHSAGEIMSTWTEAPSKSQTKGGRFAQPEVGRPRVPVSATEEVFNRVHGAPSKREDNSKLLKWQVADEPSTRTTQNPLLMRSELGAPRPPLSKDAMSRVHGMKSEDPTVKGGVQGALGGWRDPSRQGPRGSQKAPVGRARPPISKGVDDIVHGRKNVTLDGGARDALSNWRPDSPKGPPKPSRTVPNGLSFGKPSPAPEPVAELLTTKFADEWIQQQAQRE
eukprot:TRINITY_DN10783_c0_g1_i1.p1 TRINITY_DN10783_c0_g1~~TRINITY_DN10783_c0_g1_i1.p1  ORF type:complete len:329 (+),score=62.64 TRINITY_DN10783_c0_g1_i1:46-1032(+)